MLGAAEARTLARELEGLSDPEQLKAAAALVRSFQRELEQVGAFLRSTRPEDWPRP